MSTAVYETLPGVDTPVADVRRALAAVWDMEPEQAHGKAAPSEYRASQMNLVVHFGLDTTPEMARKGFETALGFSRRYPCRIMALCPREPGVNCPVEAKIFCECFIGSSRHDMTCTEAIVLTYPLEQRAYLQDQASILLESDLPIYYWPQHISSAMRLKDYTYFLGEARRIVIDSAVEKPEVPGFAWPRPELVQDLAFARVLPVRQSVGHFLSYVAPARLVQGLREIELRHQSTYAAEGRALAAWTERGAAACFGRNGSSQKRGVEVRTVVDDAAAASIKITWSYDDGARLDFDFDFERGTAVLESTLDCEQNRVGATARLLAPENALAEALFF